MKLKAAELRQMSDQELRAQLDAFKEEYFNLRFQRTSGQLEDVNRMRITRRNIARIRTIMREKELETMDAE